MPLMRATWMRRRRAEADGTIESCKLIDGNHHDRETHKKRPRKDWTAKENGGTAGANIAPRRNRAIECSAHFLTTATEMPRDGAPHRQLGEGNPRDAARRARLSGWNRARGQQPTATLLINSFRKPRRRTPFRRPLGRKMQLCAHNQLLDVAWNADQGRPMDAAMGMRRDATTAQGLWE